MGSDKNNFPTKEEFARAKAEMRYEERGLNVVCDQVLKRFHKRGVHECYLFFGSDPDGFVARVFYLKDSMIAEGEQSGLSSEIKEAIYDELTAVGRDELTLHNLTVKFDSHENVEKNYGGNYYKRLL
ncbi:MAG: hypothetical protein ABIK07_09915 [Planctomycetota bacterium]